MNTDFFCSVCCEVSHLGGVWGSRGQEGKLIPDVSALHQPKHNPKLNPLPKGMPVVSGDCPKHAGSTQPVLFLPQDRAHMDLRQTASTEQTLSGPELEEKTTFIRKDEFAGQESSPLNTDRAKISHVVVLNDRRP